MDDSMRRALEKQLRGVTPEKAEHLVGRILKLPADRAFLLLETGLGLAATSVRAAAEFVRVAPEVGMALDPESLKVWGEIGRRLASVNPESAIAFFQVSPSVLSALPARLRRELLLTAHRQSLISSTVALDGFRAAPELVRAIEDEELAARVYAIAGEIARRSATQSAEFLTRAPEVIARFRRQHPPRAHARDLSDAASRRLLERALTLAALFAEKAGGLATEFLSAFSRMPRTHRLEDHLKVLDHTHAFLERGGGIALHYFHVAARVLTVAGADALARWTDLTWRIALQDNAAVYNFLKLTPRVLEALAQLQTRTSEPLIPRVLEVVRRVSERSLVLGIECFRSSPRALASATVEQFVRWAEAGLAFSPKESRRAQAYYALETKASQQALQRTAGGLTLDRVSQTLRLYIQAMTGRSVTIQPLNHLPDRVEVNDGKTIYLPAAISEFGDEEADFKLYKVLAAHAAGQMEFGTYAGDSPELRTLADELRREYRASASERSTDSITFSTILALMPDREWAERVFTTIENGRIDFLLRHHYRGLRRDLDAVRQWMRARRPPLEELSPADRVLELLFRLALLGGVSDDVRQRFPQLVAFLENVLDRFVRRVEATVADSLRAAHVILRLLQAEGAARKAETSSEGASAEDSQAAAEPEMGEQPVPRALTERQPHPADRLEPFNFWIRRHHDPERFEWEHLQDSPFAEELEQQELEPGDQAFYYEEWDHELADFRTAWCRVIERPARRGPRHFVQSVRAQYGPMISSIRHQFQLLRPEALQKIRGEWDGEEFDLQAVIDYALDRRTSGRVSERLYVRRLRRQRDVAVSFLLDMSSSTARTVAPRSARMGAPRPSKRIIDIEKEGLVLMSEALEAVGDRYAIQGFTSEGRHNVKFYIIKDFDQKYSPEVEARIGGITYQNNTRLGAAIRHATARLVQQEARTKLLIILSDGRPYDHDYGDARYAREDTKIALRQARMAGVIPFCITIDRESEIQLRDMYGEVGYTIIDDVLSLPERLPGIYRRLTQ
jgi:hypothetical protein